MGEGMNLPFYGAAPPPGYRYGYLFPKIFQRLTRRLDGNVCKVVRSAPLRIPGRVTARDYFLVSSPPVTKQLLAA
jgi:hypothetical protein